MWTISISTPSRSNMSWTSFRMLLVFPMGWGLPLMARTFMRSVSRTLAFKDSQA